MGLSQSASPQIRLGSSGSTLSNRATALELAFQDCLCRGTFRANGSLLFFAHPNPGGVRPEAIAVMKELGIDISAHDSKHVSVFEDQTFDYVLTVCDNAKESCLAFPKYAIRIHNAFKIRRPIREPKKSAWLFFDECDMKFGITLGCSPRK